MPQGIPQSQTIAIDAPVDGWDAFSSLDNMSPTAAIILNNLIPGAGSVATRRGNLLYADLGTGLPTETVASFTVETTNSKLLAASGGGMWEISVGVLPVNLKPVSTYANNRWQTENFRKATETSVLIMCNGVDLAQVYNGTSLTALDTAGSSPAVTPNYIGCVSFKGRMYYWKDNDNAFYFTQAGSYQGVTKKFDLGSMARGGKIVFITTWSQQDAGSGSDDFLVFMFSTGEILIYQGDDPESAGYFEQVGRYVTAEPLSIRGHTNFGADLIIMTRDGYVALSTIVQQGRISDVPAFSRQIHNAIIVKTTQATQFFGWCAELYQKDGLMIFNVPLSPETFEQHVLNTVTQKWCRFKGWNFPCMAVHRERLFAGTLDGKVVALFESTSDRGTPIEFDCMYGFNYLGEPGVQKHITAAQVMTTINTPARIQLTGYADFDVPDLTPVPTPPTFIPSTWAVNPPSPPSIEGSYWDEDYWSSEGVQFTTKGWQNVSAYGFSVSLLVRFSKLNESVLWRSTNLRYHVCGTQ